MIGAEDVMLRFFAFLVLLAPLGVSAETQDGSGAMDVVYEPKVCVMDPCPQFKVVAINGEKIDEAMGADLINVDLKEIPAGRPVLVMGTWTKDGSYFQVTAKEWLLNIREKVPPKNK